MIFYNNTASMMDIFLTELMFATNTAGPMRNARRRARGMRTDREMMRKWLVRRPYCGMKTCADAERRLPQFPGSSVGRASGC